MSVRMSGYIFEYFGNMVVDLLSQCASVPSSFDLFLFIFSNCASFTVMVAVSLFVFVVLEWRHVTQLLSSIITVCDECVHRNSLSHQSRIRSS